MFGSNQLGEGAVPIYETIKPGTPAGKRTIERLITLRTGLDDQVPARGKELLLLATWNIREFDSNSYGARLDESIYYIAEIVSRFDIVAVTEVRSNLVALHRLMDVLGPSWDYIVTDETKGTAGFHERIAIVYDSNKVTFGGLAGELVLPPVKVKGPDGTTTVASEQFARTPLIAGFVSGSLKFMLTVFHVKWGDGKDAPEDEVNQLTQEITKRALEEDNWARDLVVLGDFNIGSSRNQVWDGLRAGGWVIPPDFADGIKGSNIGRNKWYDQIAVRPRPGQFEIAALPGDMPSAGVFDFYKHVFKPVDDFDVYTPAMKDVKPEATKSNFEFDSNGKKRDSANRRKWYRTYWRTHQMSDHLPLWIALRADNTDSFLADQTKL
jgi:endonuclease/exonuclease/phosphatase family metal-dependent hydrolase